MGKVYLGDECIGEMYTQQVVEYNEVVVDILKKPASRYMVDENGVAKTIEGDITGAFDDGVTIELYTLYYAFYKCTGLTGSVSFPNLTSVGDYGLYSAFYGCTGLTGSVSFPNLTSIGLYGLRIAFYGCTGLTGSVSFPNLIARFFHFVKKKEGQNLPFSTKIKFSLTFVDNNVSGIILKFFVHSIVCC